MIIISDECKKIMCLWPFQNWGCQCTETNKFIRWFSKYMLVYLDENNLFITNGAV